MSLHKDLTGADLHIARTATGNGSPVGVVTPGIIGQEYFDLVGDVLYIATGLTDTDWSAVSGGGGGSPTGPAGGDLGGTYPNPSVETVGGTAAATIAADLPTTDEKAALAGTSGSPDNTNRYVTDADPRNTNARTPSGAAGGDLGGTYPNPTVAQVGGTAAATVAANLPSADEKAALAGTSGTPGAGNAFVTDADPRNTNGRPPSGAAGGDLAGNYPAPTVAQASQSFALTGVITPTLIGANQNDYNPSGAATAAVIRLDAGAAYNITGLAGGSAGRVIVLHNKGSNPITLTHADVASSAANRFLLPGASSLVLTPNKCVTLSYDGADGRWRVASPFDPYGNAANTACQGNDSRLSDARTPTAHGSTHLPAGSDPLTTAAPGATGVATAAAAGSANSFARSDHVHQSNTAPVNVTKAAAAIGTSGEPARADHKHDVTTAAAVANPPGTANAEGSATSLARSDHTHALAAFGTGAGTFCQGNDARLSDDRTASGIRTATTVVSVSSATAPTTGQALVATSSTAATWQTLGGGAPSGPAGGDLAGTYPNPTVAQASQAFALTGIITPTQIGANQNNYSPTGLSTASTLRISASGAFNITGITGGAAGRLLLLENVGSFNIALTHDDASSTAANRFLLPGGASVVISSNKSATIGYDTTSGRWRLVALSVDPYGSTANTVCQGNDSRLSDDRTASGLRTATTVVAISGATAPSAGQALVATGATAATWQDVLPFYGSQESLNNSTITGTTAYQQKLRLSVNVPATGAYRLSWCFTWYLTSSAQNFLARVQQNDSTDLWTMVQEPQDTSTAQRQPTGCFRILNLTAGSYNFDLDFATSSTGNTAGISQAAMDIQRVA